MNIIGRKNSKMPYFLCSIMMTILFSLNVVYAADISIVVNEKGSGVPVEGATVVLDNGDVYDETSKAGRVNFIDIASPQQVKILATGYETLIKKMKKNKSELIVYLEPLSFDGEVLEVTADRVVEKTSKITMSSEELINAAGSAGDPLRAITALPGIVSTDDGGEGVYMRGSNGNENITWVNHTPVGYLYHFGGLQSTINSSMLEDINVFLGGFPVEYGDALGGVIDVKLRTPKNDRMHYQFDISTILSSFLIEGPVGDGSDINGDSFYIAGRRSYLDVLLSPARINKFFDDGKDDPDKIILVPRFYDFQTLYRHKLKGGYVDSYIFAAGDEMKMVLGSTSTKSDPQLAGALRQKISYQTTGFTWQQRWDSQWSSLTTLAYLHNKTALRVGKDDQGQPFFLKDEAKTLHFQPEVYWRPRDNTDITFGLSGNYSKNPVYLYLPLGDVQNDPAYDFTSRQKFRFKKNVKIGEISPYVKARYQWTNRFTTQLGIRYTNIGVTGGFSAHQFSPRLTMEYKLTSETLLTGVWGRYIQTPNGTAILPTLGNPGLLMTEAEHRILGIEHKINSLYKVKAEVYYKPMKNLSIEVDDKPPKNYVNRGTGKAYGFDLFVKRTPSQGKIGWVSLSWAKSKRTNEITGVTRNFSGDQPLTLNVVWGQPFGGSWKRWDWSLKGQLRSGKPYTAVVDRFKEDPQDPESRWIPVYGEQNAKRLPTFYKLDLRVGREVLFNRSKLTFYVELQNATFANNIVEYEYGEEYENIDNPTKVIGLRFFPFAGIEMAF